MSHPEGKSLKVISKTIDEGSPIFRSPHVGNVSNAELSVIYGVAGLGGEVKLEIVDTIRGKDRYSLPRVAIVGMKRILLASNKGSGKIVGSCEVLDAALEELRGEGLLAEDADPKTLKDLHLDSLRRALPESVGIVPSSEYFAQIGAKAYAAVLRETVNVLGRTLRSVNEEGKIEEGIQAQDFEDIYGLGELKSVGLLPPLEAMMAIEVIKKAIEAPGKDVEIVHIAGPDMIKYTKDEAVMKPVEAIAERVLLDIGLPANVSIDYVVPCMATIQNTAGFDPVVGPNIQSQYDILAEREKEVIGV